MKWTLYPDCPFLPDMDESRSMRLVQLFDGAGAVVSFIDPHVPEIPPMREHHMFRGAEDGFISSKAVTRRP
ncbi:hypothetical protein [uncultured Sulfitobacter sp.]|uniref:hypothetical protein n=1 Tax=uncultured Sulfitobacter sp. TaxID=191468 RepID=UPI0030D820C4